jgi:alpha-beta hydrolase superfamily lysophospholipase
VVPVAIVLVALVLLGRSGGGGDLEPWHRWAPESELEAPLGAGFEFADYLALEETVFAELEGFLGNNGPRDPGSGTSRYQPNGRNNPAKFPRNWNRSYVEIADDAVGSALLIHGLTDSPYSLRSLSDELSARGVSVVGLRLPGHGTVPEALDRVGRSDWRAAVQIAARHAAGLKPPAGTFALVGYSNGAALAVQYAMDALDETDLPMPDRLVLVSPAVGITRFAVLAGLPRVLRFVPFTEGLRWTGIEPEIDPYKYSSFPANAGYQTHRLTVSNRNRLADLARLGRGRDLPPVLAFVSLADATVKMEAVAGDLMQPLANPDSEMVVFDVNRDAEIAALFAFDPAERLRWLAEQAPLAWTFTAVGNRDPGSREVIERRWPAGSQEPVIQDLGMSWPDGVYSLSHISLQFPPDDPIYGSSREAARDWGLPLGSLEPRGERGLLRLDMSTMMRLRHNPFYPYFEQRVLEFLGLSVAPAATLP